MLKLSPFCLAAVLLLQLPGGFAQTAPLAAMVDPALAARIDAAIAPFFQANEPGATIIVTREGKVVLRKAYGLADVGSKLPLQADNSMRLGSITKQFTAAAILLLAEQGKLAVTDPLTKFLPDYPTHGKTITIEHLLTHTSGVASYTSKPDFRANTTRDMSVAQMLDYFKNDPLEFEPGSRYEYSNSGYFLLGAVIEKVSGQPYAEFMAQNIFVPLGMTQTAYEGKERSPTLRAAGHSKTNSGFGPSAPLSMSQPFAAGALVSTVDDLARWDAAIAAGKLLTPASWAQAFTPHKLNDGKATHYGYGWELGTLRGAAVQEHGGAINGFSTFDVRVPSKQVFVAVLSNAENGLVSIDMVARKAAAVAIDKPFASHAPVVLAPAELDAVTGVYKVDEQRNLTIRRSGEQITIQRTGRPPVELTAWAPDRFYVKTALPQLSFGRNAKGEVDRLTIEDDGVETVHLRTGDASERKFVNVPQATLDQLVGRYELRPGLVLELRRDGANLFGQIAGQPTVQLWPQSDSLFYIKEADAEVLFENGNGQLLLKQGGRATPAKRI